MNFGKGAKFKFLVIQKCFLKFSFICALLPYKTHKILRLAYNSSIKKTYYRHTDNDYKLKPVSQTEA